MRLYQHTGNIKSGLFVLGLALVSGLMLYTQSLVKNMREDNRKIVQLYAELMAKIVLNESDENLNFIFREKLLKQYLSPLLHNFKHFRTITHTDETFFGRKMTEFLK